MSKVNDGLDEADFAVASPTHEEIEVSENQPLRTLFRQGRHEDVQDFISCYGLLQKAEVFHKAALLIEGKSSASQDVDLTADELFALDGETSRKWHQPKLLYFTIMVCSLGAIEQGWAQTAMNGANLYFPAALGIGSASEPDIFIVGLINSGIYLSTGLWGAWMSAPINSRIGRRGTIFTGSCLCLVANLGSAFSWNWVVLLFFRLLLGTGLGLNASTVSVFAAESVPAYIRGGLAVSWQMWTAFGIFLGFLANVSFYNFGANTWRLQLAAPFVPVVPLLLTIYACPESAAWYIKQNRYDKALTSLVRLRSTELQAARDVYSNYISRQTSSSPKQSLPNDAKPTTYLSSIFSLLTIPRNRHALVASYTVMLSQQLCGINIISFYSSTIFQSSGFSSLAALWASVIFGFVNFIGAFPAIWTMDSFGRRRLLLWTLPVMAAVMMFAGLTFRMPEGKVQLWALAGLTYLFCALYSPGMGPVPSAYSAEVFPLSVREIGMSAAVATANFWAAILSVTFPGLLEAAGEEGAFQLYGILNLLAWVLCWVAVRETKAVPLEEMDEVFESTIKGFVKARWRERLSWRKGKSEGYAEVEQEED